MYSADKYDRMTPPQNAVTHVVRYWDGRMWREQECHSYAGAKQFAARLGEYAEPSISRVAR